MHLVTQALAPAPRLPPERLRTLWAERRCFLKRRWRAPAEDGADFGFDLTERLADGCVIWADGACEYVIRQIPEEVLEIALASPAAAALTAWKLGNLHQPVQVHDGRLWVADDPSVRRMLERDGVPFTGRTEIFNPLRVAEHAGA